jgi:hypothetical protein
VIIIKDNGVYVINDPVCNTDSHLFNNREPRALLAFRSHFIDGMYMSNSRKYQYLRRIYSVNGTVDYKKYATIILSGWML